MRSFEGTYRSLVSCVLGIAIIASAPGASTPQTAKPPTPPEQADFAMVEESPDRPVDVPAEVLAQLKKDEFVLSCLQEGQSSSDLAGDWFVGSVIQLGNQKHDGMVVQPRKHPATVEPCLLHVHSMPFWVFVKTRNGYALVLTDSVQLLRVLRTKSNGYRDIETSMSTTLGETRWFYKFDGHKYSLFRKTSTPP
jgi:hypothetical protein